jgi:GGDEF domain-containing protein
VLLLLCDRPAALRAADAVRAAVAAIDVLPGGPPGVSVGVAVLPDDGTTVEALLAASDAALYVAKTQGRGRVAQVAPLEPASP